MTLTDIQVFNNAISLAQSGKRQEAYNKLWPLLPSNPRDTNLLMWLAFTAPDLSQAEGFVNRAVSIGPKDPAVVQAKAWLTAEKAKLPQLITDPPPFLSPPLPTTTPPITPAKSAKSKKAIPIPKKPSKAKARQRKPVNLTQTTIRFFYAIIGLGVLLTIASVFMPWLSATLQVKGKNYKISMNGLGILNGDPDPVLAFNKDNPTQLRAGVYTLLLALPLSLLTAGGFIRHHLLYTVGLVVLGIIDTVVIVTNLVESLFKLTRTVTVAVSPGNGIYVGLAGCLLILVVAAGLLIFALRQKKPVAVSQPI